MPSTAADMPVGAKVKHNNITFTKTGHDTSPWRTYRFGWFTDEQMDEFLALDQHATENAGE